MLDFFTPIVNSVNLCGEWRSEKPRSQRHPDAGQVKSKRGRYVPYPSHRLDMLRARRLNI
jgi:hypothetical protein